MAWEVYDSRRRFSSHRLEPHGIMRALLDRLLADFDISYDMSNWLSLLEVLQHLSESLRRIQSLSPSDPEYDRWKRELRDTIACFMTWLFSIAMYWNLSIDRGWKSWNLKVNRKSYLLPHEVIPDPGPTSTPRPDPTPGGEGTSARPPGPPPS